MKMKSIIHEQEGGFTLLELLVTVAIAMFVLAGMSALFISQTRTAQVLNAKSEIINDLFLASQVMQQELRGAKAICWQGANKRLHYQPLSSTDDLVAACNTNVTSNGNFTRKNAGGSHPTPYVFWNRVGPAGNQELIRNMKKNAAIAVSPTDNAAAGALQAVRTVTLTAQYKDRDHITRDLSLSFKVWPRNTQ